MNYQTLTGTIKDIKRARNSYYGNPNFKFLLVTDNGVELPISTLNDMMDNYKLGSFLEGKLVSMDVKVNRKSNKMVSFEEV